MRAPCFCSNRAATATVSVSLICAASWPRRCTVSNSARSRASCMAARSRASRDWPTDTLADTSASRIIATEATDRSRLMRLRLPRRARVEAAHHALDVLALALRAGGLRAVVLGDVRAQAEVLAAFPALEFIRRHAGSSRSDGASV